MTKTPLTQVAFYYHTDTDPDIVFQTCDSTVAVLTQEDITAWMALFKEIGESPDAPDYCDFGIITRVYDIDGVSVVVVSDSGGEYAAAEFSSFCDERDIANQFIIDGMDCAGISVTDIYTGMSVDNSDILALVHKIYN
jgi:hypothetical protein